MEHNVDPVHYAETVWLHYDELRNSKEVKTPSFKKLVEEQETYWREKYLRLTESEVPNLMAGIGIRLADTDNNQVHE